MTDRVVSGGQQAAPLVHGGQADLDQPAWLGSAVLATAITAFIILTAILGGQGAIEFLGIDFGWALVIAGLIAAAEMFGLGIAVNRIRAAYRRAHAQPPVKPFDLAA